MKEKVLNLLTQALNKEKKEEKIPDYSDEEWQRILSIAQKHCILPLLYPLSENWKFPQDFQKQLKHTALQTVQQSYHLLFLSKYIVELLKKNDIEVVLLKGVGTAAYYSVPEFRKSGDVDILLLNKTDIKKVTLLLEMEGFVKSKEQHAWHHIVFQTPEAIEVEIHTMLSEPFDEESTNLYLESLLPKMKKEIEWKDVMGVNLPVLKEGYHAYQLLLHMLHHFLRSGFGLKLLCDWVVLWNRGVEKEELEKYETLVRESGLFGFSQMITSLCVSYLGLDERKSVCKIFPTSVSQEFMEDILEAEEFGKSSTDRMVILRGIHIRDYFREFHHQMQLNYPKCAKIWIIWPVLWMATLIRFLYNNKKIRKTSALQIMKKAKERSRRIEQLELFRKK